MEQSPKGSLNKADWLAVGHEAFILAIPAILLVGASAETLIPQNSAYGAIALFAINTIIDLIRKANTGK